MLTFIVYGDPVTQGSKNKNRYGAMYESSKGLPAWRQAVRQAVMLAAPMGERKNPVLITGPVELSIIFSLKRPKSRRKDQYPMWKFDADKLARAVGDSLTEMKVYEDDGRIVDLHVRKFYAGDTLALPVPGAVITVRSAVNTV